MNWKIKSQEDFWAGVMFVGFGFLAIYIAQDYPMGTAMRMGPGYFPTYLGVIMAILGGVIVLTALRTEGEQVKPFAWRAMLMLTVGFAFYGWAMDRLGFFIALSGLVLCAALAGKEFRLGEVLIMIVVLVAGCWGLFIYGLDLSFPLWWWR